MSAQNDAYHRGLSLTRVEFYEGIGVHQYRGNTVKTVIYKLMPAGPAEAFAVLDLDESLRYAVERDQIMHVPLWPILLGAPDGAAMRTIMLQFSRLTFPAGHSVLAGFIDGIGAGYLAKVFPPLESQKPTPEQADFYRALRAAAGVARQ